MNFRIVSFFVFLISFVGISNAKNNPEPTKIQPGLVLFFDGHKIPYSLLEKVDLDKRRNKLAKLMNEQLVPRDHNSTWETLDVEESELFKKIDPVLAAIAKRLDACAVVSYLHDSRYEFGYVDPTYNITQEAIDTLNKEYLQSLPYKKPISLQDMLHEAILNDSAKEIQQAVQAGADINCKKDGETPLKLAVLYKKPSAVKSLLECGAKADNELFQESLKLNDIKSAVLLAINSGADLDAIYSNGYLQDTLLVLAAYKIDFESVLLLIKSGASFSGDTVIKTVWGIEKTIMCLAVSHGRDSELELIQTFINHDYDVNKIWEDDKEHHFLLESGKVAILELFIKNGANPNQIIRKEYPLCCTWTPLFEAIDSGSKQSVEILLNAGANINQKANPYPNQPPLCPNGPQTPLSFAINKGHIAIAEFLRKRGAKL